jgi:hypothetical protein
VSTGRPAAEAARGIKCATLGRRVAGIHHAHKVAGLPSPTGRASEAVMQGARRTLGVAAIKKSAATSDKVLAMVAGGARGSPASAIAPCRRSASL